jgi:Cof subfamily protein (haloacid dehalogenase superfamily)
MSRVRLVLTDVDGTFVGSSNEVPAHVWAAAKKLTDSGIDLAICTGRAAFGATLEYAKRLRPNGFHAFQNGASILHLGSSESISQPISAGSVEALVARARHTKQFVELYADTSFGYEGAPQIAEAHARLLGVPFATRPLADLNSPIVRVQWIVSHAEKMALLADLDASFPDLEVTSSTSPLMPEIDFVMLTVRGANKASAVEVIAARENVPLENVMFVGDGDNDIAPMKRVGFPVAMSNASPDARAAAKFHVGSVEDGAVADAFALAMKLQK